MQDQILDQEKRSLSLHVDMCSRRYANINIKLNILIAMNIIVVGKLLILFPDLFDKAASMVLK